MEWLVLGLIIVVIIVIVYIGDGVRNTCPRCNKFYGMKEISRKHVETRSTSVDVKREVKNSKGDVIKSYYEAVPAIKYIYECVEKCESCGYLRTVIKEQVKRDD